MRAAHGGQSYVDVRPKSTAFARLAHILDLLAEDSRPRLEPRRSASPRLTATWQSLDTAGSALTGRHLPAAREHSHLFWSESCACAPSFSLVSAGYRRFMKEGRHD